MSDSDAVLPVLTVEPGHVAEAKRALAAQGRALDDAAVERLLWTARALPAALDLLADADSPLPLAEACFTAVAVERGDAPPPNGAPALLLARRVGPAIQVDVVDRYPYLDNDEVHLRCRVTLSVSPGTDAERVRLVRFHLR
ncbi:MAG: hypothetical protein HYS27_13665 [Deltaproteobacteria bacterium]|nr:hypothetical protein [Deltaproteobacteria bacterium]